VLRGQEATLTVRRDEVRRRADYLRHVVEEIDRARLKPGEAAALELEARRLSQAGALGEHARRITEAADGDDASALQALALADRALGAIEKSDPSVAGWRELLDGAYANLSELARLAREYAEGMQEDPARLAEVERRRDVIFRLTQKHGASIETVLETRRTAGEELDLLDTADTDLRALAARGTGAQAALAAAADAPSARRKDGAERLGRTVSRLLPGFGLPGGRLAVELTPLEEVTSQGREAVAFAVRLNLGLDPMPLGKVASGGELSRLMLALKVVLAR